MLLVPRQLQRHGMTGSASYYGGRLTPGQAYAVTHPQPPPPMGPRPPATPAGVIGALQYLRDAGVISPAEFEDLRARAGV
jgi:hypothetical protein